jgi:HK97 family phage portal protein
MAPFRDALGHLFGRQKAANPSPPGIPSPIVTPVTVISIDDILGMSESDMYRTQPYLRTVVSFFARNIAQLGMQTFARVSDTDRRRELNSPAAQLLTHPNPTTTGYELKYALVSDLMLYDRAYWLITSDLQSPSGWRITAIPPSWVVGMTLDNLFAPKTYFIQPNTDMTTERVELPASQFIQFHGWNPHDPKEGSTPLHALKEILAEQVSAQRYRNQVWKNGGRTSGTISRPVDAPTWDQTTRDRFKKQWRDQFAGDNSDTAGGTALLEDGMTYAPVGFSAKDNEFVEAAKLALNVVCSVYHISPVMVGQLDAANYSNVREFRKMLYGDTLGSPIAQIEDRINGMLLPMIGEPPKNYVEFNIAEKLQGNFEDQATSLQIAVGGPWMSVNEGRALNNMRSLGPDYDEVITPLNVVRGGGEEANPQDSAPGPGETTGPGDSQPEQQPKQADIERYLRRQGSAVLSRLGAGKAVDEAWDDDRWNRELAEIVPASVARDINTVRKHELALAVAAGKTTDAMQEILTDWPSHVLGWNAKGN